MSEGVTNERGIEFSSKWFLTASLITPSGPESSIGAKKGAAERRAGGRKGRATEFP